MEAKVDRPGAFQLGGVNLVSYASFDGDGTRFFAYIDTYTSRDEGDIFIKFPQVGPFDRLPYTER